MPSVFPAPRAPEETSYHRNSSTSIFGEVDHVPDEAIRRHDRHDPIEDPLLREARARAVRPHGERLPRVHPRGRLSLERLPRALQYGFSISEAIEMLDAKQDTAEFRESLQEQRQKLERERILLDYRQRRIESVLDVLETDGKVDFKLVHIPDQLYVNASHGRDFTVSMENEKVLAEYYDLLSITSCARIITRENLLDDSPAVDPDYINTVSVGEEHFLSPYAREHVKRLRLGRCLAIPPHGHPRGVYPEGDVRRTVRAPRRPWPDHLRGHPHHADVPQPRRRGQRHRGSLRAC